MKMNDRRRSAYYWIYPTAVFYSVCHCAQFCTLWLDSGENFGPAVNILSAVVWLSWSWCEGTNKETQTPPQSFQEYVGKALLPLSGIFLGVCFVF